MYLEQQVPLVATAFSSSDATSRLHAVDCAGRTLGSKRSMVVAVASQPNGWHVEKLRGSEKNARITHLTRWSQSFLDSCTMLVVTGNWPPQSVVGRRNAAVMYTVERLARGARIGGI